jgi:hypothetical protein
LGRISGVPVEVATAHLFRFRDGLIVLWEVYEDRDEARKAAGLME